MADATEITYTDEEQAQIRELLTDLDQDPYGDTFAPMAEIFRADLAELAPRPPEEAEGGPGETIEAPVPTSDQDALGGLGGEDSDDLGDIEETPAQDSIFGADQEDSGGFGADSFDSEPAASSTPDADAGAFDTGLDSGLDSDFESTPTTDDFGLADLGAADEFEAGGSAPAADDFGDFGGLDEGVTPSGRDESETEAPTADPTGLGDFEADLGGSMDLDDTPLSGSGLEDLAAGSGTEFGDDFGSTTDLAADSGLDSGGDFGADLGGDFGADLTGDSVADLDTDSGAGSDFGGDFGGDLGSDLSSDLGSDLGGDFGSELGGASADIGADLGDLSGDFGTDAGTGLGSDFGTDSPAGAEDFGSIGDSGPGAGLDDDFGQTPTAGPDFGEMEAPAAAGGGDFEDFSATDDFDLGDSGGGGAAGALGGAGQPGESLDLADDLSEMAEQAKLQSGIGDEFTDEELANIRQAILDYPPAIKKAVIDVIVNEKITPPDQRLLMNMVADQAEPETVADFLEARLGYRPDLTPSDIRKDGVRIIYAEGLSPEALAAKRRRTKFLALGVGAGLLALVLSVFSVYMVRRFSIEGTYDEGLEQLYLARKASLEQREAHRLAAEKFFQAALASDGGRHNLEYLNRYGIAYMAAGFPEDAFVKLFGKVTPDYGTENPASGWNAPGRRAPLIRMAEGSAWPDPEDWGTNPPRLIDRDNITRTVLVPGAYIVSRLRDGELDHRTVVNLGRFHAQNSRRFLDSDEGRKYKNDMLGIDYYRLILTLMNLPDDVEATAGIAKIYYDRAEYGAAAREYNHILDKFPTEAAGHSGLLNTYIEIWKKEQDPRLVIARHRLLRKLGLEEELPIYILAKLAGFYIDLDEDELRIKYQVDPVDSVSGLDLRDNATHLLSLVFGREEDRDGEVIVGSQYGEGFYQRGRFLIAQKEPTRALRQFQNAYKYDPRHYLAINQMGEYYKSLRDYDRAIQYFDEARRTYDKYYRDFGARPEDETLMAGDYGKIFYNIGSLVFLRYAGVPAGSEAGVPGTRIYPDRGNRVEDESLQKRRQQLAEARTFFDQAFKEGVRDEIARVEMKFWSGWVDYTAADFAGALGQWETIDTEYAYSDPVLLMAMGNAYFYTDQLRSALGNYLKIQSDFENRAAEIPRPNPEDKEHRDVFLTLAAAYNNIGAVHEKEFAELAARGAPPATLRDLEQRALRSYWSAIEAARKVGQDSEIARTNNQLAFKYLRASGVGPVREPLLDDWVSPVLVTTQAKQKATEQ